MTSLDEDKQVLIDLVLWYQEEYHHRDYSDFIEKIKNAKNIEELSIYEKIVDDWLD